MMERPTKATAIARLQKALDVIPELKRLPRSDSSPEFEKWRRDTRVAIGNTFGGDSPYVEEFNQTLYFQMPVSDLTTDYEFQNYYVRRLDSAASVLESMIDEIKEYWEDENQTPPSPAAQKEERTNTKEVFIVHGRDNEAKETVARFLTRLDLTPVILDEQSNQGLTIIEKFERHAQVGFAVALLTPDDAGSLQGDGSNLNPRARQNVIFELGFFIGKLGREGVCALTKGNVEIPSDYAGVVYIPLDDSGAWKFQLVKELKAASFAVDANKAL